MAKATAHPVRARSSVAHHALRNGRLERGPDVLWSLSGTGIVLHQIVRRRFLELDRVGYELWSYLDGARSVDEAIRSCVNSATERRRLYRIVEVLAVNEFIVDANASVQP